MAPITSAFKSFHSSRRGSCVPCHWRAAVTWSTATPSGNALDSRRCFTRYSFARIRGRDCLRFGRECDRGGARRDAGSFFPRARPQWHTYPCVSVTVVIVAVLVGVDSDSRPLALPVTRTPRKIPGLAGYRSASRLVSSLAQSAGD